MNAPDLLGQGRLPVLLVVDDQPANIQALYQVFAADHQVLMATSGAQALALCESRQPDLVLLDLVMPGMDGLEVCRQLKGSKTTRDIPVIFVTARHREADETDGLEAGAVDFITKPINPRVVRARVKTHLTLKAQADLLRRWVYIDGLTGVANRRAFDDRLETEWRRSQRANSPLSVILLDVDHFKRFNDHHGHQAGDDCLRRLAQCLLSNMKRPADLLARYGGEEFVCLLPDTPAEGALALANCLRLAVADLGLPHQASDTAAFITMSLGVATWPGDAPHSAQELLHTADARLYAAKAGGRNQVCAALPASASVGD